MNVRRIDEKTMTDYDEKPQALRYRPTPGGLLLNLTVRKLAHVRYNL